MAELTDAHDSKFEIYRFFCVRLRAANRALKLINKSSTAVELEFTQIARWGLEVSQNVEVDAPDFVLRASCQMVNKSLGAR